MGSDGIFVASGHGKVTTPFAVDSVSYLESVGAAEQAWEEVWRMGKAARKMLAVKLSVYRGNLRMYEVDKLLWLAVADRDACSGWQQRLNEVVLSGGNRWFGGRAGEAVCCAVYYRRFHRFAVFMCLNGEKFLPIAPLNMHYIYCLL